MPQLNSKQTNIDLSVTSCNDVTGCLECFLQPKLNKLAGTRQEAIYLVFQAANKVHTAKNPSSSTN